MMRGLERDSWFLSGTVAAVGLAPYLTLPVPFELGLRLQAALIVALLCAVCFVYRNGIFGAIREIPRPLKIGLCLYAGAAVWGGVVGLVSGNPPRYLLGQVLSMLLLPAGAIAFSAVPRRLGRQTAAGLSAAAIAALTVHLGAAALGFEPLATAKLPSMFKLPNGTDFVGPALLATLLAAGWWGGERSWTALAGALAGAVLILGGMSRAQWLAVVVGVTVLTVLSLPWRSGRLLAVSGIAAFVLGLGVMLPMLSSLTGEALVQNGFGRREGPGAAPDVGRPRSNSLHLEGGTDRARTLVRCDIPEHIAVLEARVSVRGNVGEGVTLWVAGRADSSGTVERRWEASTVGSGEWRELPLVVVLPAEIGHVGIGARASGGNWQLENLHVMGFDSLLLGWVRRLTWRAHSLGVALDSPTTVGTLRYRLREWQAVREEWLGSSWPRILVGHGLGAVFPFENVGWDKHGGRVRLHEANYIHNFYVFLGFKLGVAGVGALAGLLILTLWTARHAWKLRKRAECWFAAAATASWIAYLLWSVTSPEILNFRMAPLWGLVVVATYRATNRTQSAGSGRTETARSPETGR